MLDAPVRAFEWLPSELFVDPDELYDHSMMGTYPLARVVITTIAGSVIVQHVVVIRI